MPNWKGFCFKREQFALLICGFALTIFIFGLWTQWTQSPVIITHQNKNKESKRKNSNKDNTDGQFFEKSESDRIWAELPIVSSPKEIKNDKKYLVHWVSHHKTGSVVMQNVYYTLSNIVYQHWIETQQHFDSNSNNNNNNNNNSHNKNKINKENNLKYLSNINSVYDLPCMIWKYENAFVWRNIEVTPRKHKVCLRSTPSEPICGLFGSKQPRFVIDPNGIDNQLFDLHLTNIIREPVSIVISGLNYHSQEIPDPRDPWLRKAIFKDATINCIYNNKKIYSSIINYVEKNNNTFSIGIDKNILNQHKNTKANQFYKEMIKISMKFALFIEYSRFKCHEWNKLIESFLLIKQIQIETNMRDINDVNINININSNDNSNYVNRSFDIPLLSLKHLELAKQFAKGYIIKFEYFYGFPDLSQIDNILAQKLEKISHFNTSSFKLLNMLPGFDDFTIDEKKVIVDQLKKFDINSWSQTQLVNSKHVTKGVHNRKEQVQLLLSDKQVCNDLKQKTLMLDYYWLYPNYC